MKDFIKNFIKGGMKDAGFGPLILVIFYYIYSFTINFHTISIQNVNKTILSSLLLALSPEVLVQSLKLKKSLLDLQL